MKNRYLVQPYAVGSKTGKSLAFVIPHDVVIHYRLNPSTVIILRTENLKKKIILEAIEDEETRDDAKDDVAPILDNSNAIDVRNQQRKETES